MQTRDPVRVLIVEDDPRVQELLRHSLAAFGLVVVGVAGDGIEAGTLFRRMRPRAVVLDLGLPGQDGWSVLREMKQVDPAVVVVIVTGSQDADDRHRALEQGAVGVISKPFRIDELFRGVQGAFLGLLGRTDRTPLDEQYARYVPADPAELRSGQPAPAGASPRAQTPVPAPPPVPETPASPAPIVAEMRPEASEPGPAPLRAVATPPAPGGDETAPIEQQLADLRARNEHLTRRVEEACAEASEAKARLEEIQTACVGLAAALEQFVRQVRR